MLMMFAAAALVPMPRGVAVVRSSVREPAAILKWGDATLTMKQKISGDAKANANRADQFVPSAVQAARDRGLARGWGAAATLLSTRATTADEVCTPTLVRPAHKTPSHAQELLRIRWDVCRCTMPLPTTTRKRRCSTCWTLTLTAPRQLTG